MTFSWPKLIILPLAALFLIGASCSINVGAAADGGVYRSTDHGVTWAQSSFVRQDKKGTVSLNDVTVRTLVPVAGQAGVVYIGTRGSGLWMTQDGGDHWVSAGLSGTDVTSLAIDTTSAGTMYAAVGPTVQKTIDGGKTWKPTYTESQAGQSVQTLALNPLQPMVLWAFTTGGKGLLSTDSGVTWALKTDQLTGGVRTAWFDVDGSNRTYVWLRTGGLTVADGTGINWTSLNAGLESFPDAQTIYDTAIGDPTAAPWYMVTGYGLLRSSDRGVTWTPIKTLTEPSTTQMTAVAVNSLSPAELFVVTGQKLQHSTDGGLTWAIRTLPTKRSPVLLRFDPASPDRLWFGTFKKA